MSIWEKTKCVDLLKGQTVVEIDSNLSVEEGCETLIKHGISSAPVFCQATQSYVGMLDYRDVAAFVLVAFKRNHLDIIEEENSGEESIDRSKMNRIFRSAASGHRTKSGAIADLSSKNPFHSVPQESPLSAVIETMSGKQSVHRIMVTNPMGRVVGVLSQTDIVRFILKNKGLFEEKLRQSLESLEIGGGPVVSINADSMVLDAMERMAEFAVSSIAVVDASGCLLGNISMADIRYVIKHGRFNRLWLPCLQFVSSALSEKGLENDGMDCYPVFEVHQDSTLLHSAEKMMAVKCHRLWIVNESQHVQGVISLTDIIRVICHK